MNSTRLLFWTLAACCAGAYATMLTFRMGYQLPKLNALGMRYEINRSIQTLGFDKAYASFQERHPEGTMSNHVASHFFGEYLHKTKGIAGLTECNQSHGDGCAHSVYLAELLSKPTSSFLDVCNTRPSDACWHALGHALAIRLPSGDLKPALGQCKHGSKDEEALCVNGVFMQHFMPALFLPSGDLPYYRPFHPENPYDVCHYVPDGYTYYCMEELVVWWRSIFFQRYEIVSLLCSRLPDDRLRTSCYTAMGSDAAYALTAHSDAIDAVCRLPSGHAFQQACSQGANSYPRTGQDSQMRMD